MRAEGNRFERAAAGFLGAKGYRILARNFNVRVGEIDLVAERGGELVFVEVKGRRGADPREAVIDLKMDRVRRAAEVWLSMKDAHERPFRFDVVFVTEDAAGAMAFDHVEEAF